MLYKLDRSGTEPKLVRIYEDNLEADSSRRRVVLFPGAGLDLVALHNSPKSVAGSIKYIEQLLTSSRSEGTDPVDIYMYIYHDSFKEMQDEGTHYKRDHFTLVRTKPDFTPNPLGQEEGLGKVLKPMLLNDGENWNSLTSDELKYRLSKITLCGHSYGGIAIQHIADAMLYELRQAGWKDEAIAEVMKELVAVTVAGVGRVDFPAPNFTNFYFNASNDIGSMSSIYRDMPEEMDYATLLKQCGYWRASEVISEHDITQPGRELVSAVKERVLSRRAEGSDMPKPIWRAQPSGYSIHALLPDDAVRWIEQRPEGKLCRVLLGKLDEHNPHAGTYDKNTPITHDFRNFMHGEHYMGDVLINVMNNAVMRDQGIGDGHQLALTTPLTSQQHTMRRDNHKYAAVSERGIVR